MTRLNTISIVPLATGRHRPVFGIMAPLYDTPGDGGAAGAAGGEGSGEGSGAGEGVGEGAGAGASGTTDDAVTMTQAELQALIKGRVGAALKEAQGKGKPAVSAEEVASLRKFKEDKEREDLEKKGEYAKALTSVRTSVEESFKPQLEEKDKTIGTLTSRLHEALIGSELTAAASAGDAFNVEQVVELNQKFVKLDENFKPMVVDKEGNQRFVAGQPMTPRQLVAEFLKQNPNHVKVKTGVGGGAPGGKAAAGGDTTPIQQLEAEVKKAEEEVLRTGTPRAIAAHSAKIRELDAAKKAAA